MRGAGDGTFTYAQRYETNDLPFALAIADVDRDGAFDVVVANEEVDGSP